MATINYITSAAFRNTFFDTDGTPLINGYLYSFEDLDHGCPKALYKSNIIVHPATTPPEYPNPIILDSSGSVPTPSAIFFADDSQYYLELRRSDDVTVVQTEEHWPPEEGAPPPPTDEIDVTNFIANSDFSEVIKGEFVNAELGTTEKQVAFPHWFFIRSNTNATIDIKFEKFLLGQTDVPDNPYGYIQHDTSVVGGGAETFKDIYYVIGDVRSFSGNPISLGFWAKSGSSSTIEIIVRQYFGAAGSAPVDTIIASTALTTDWVGYEFPNELIPSIAGKTIDPERGRFELIFRMPLNLVNDVELTHIQLNKGETLLEYQYLPQKFTTAKNLIIQIQPRTPSIYYKYDGTEIPYDWTSVYTTDQGVIWQGSPLVGGSMEWWTNDVPNYWLTLCPDVSGALPHEHIQYISSYPRLYGVLGNRYGERYTTSTVLTNTVTITNSENGAVTDAVDVGTGFTIIVTQQGTGVLPEIFTVQTLPAVGLTPGTYFTFTSILKEGPTTVNYAIYLRVDNSGLPPTGLPGTTRLLQLDLASIDSADEVATKLKNITDPLGFGLPSVNGVFIRAWAHGSINDPDRATRTDRGDGTTGDNVGTLQPDEFKSHTHDTTADADGATGVNEFIVTGATVIPTGATGGNETRPINRYSHIIIKY